MERNPRAWGAPALLGCGGDGQTLLSPAGDCIYHGMGNQSACVGRTGRGDPAFVAGSTKGQSWGLTVLLLRLIEPILIQDAEVIIDLNKLSVKEKL